MPDCKATVSNLTTPPQQSPPPSVLEQKFGSALISFKVHEADAANTQVTFCVESDDGTGKGLFFKTSTLTKSGTSAHAVASPDMCASRYLPPLDVLSIQRSLRCPAVSRHPSSAGI